MISKHLPTIWAIRGVDQATGLIFLTDFCAKQWLKERGIPLSVVSIIPAEVIYYPDQNTKVRFQTMEELVAERNEALDRENQD